MRSSIFYDQSYHWEAYLSDFSIYVDRNLQL
jgi:hypothetical protein